MFELRRRRNIFLVVKEKHDHLITRKQTKEKVILENLTVVNKGVQNTVLEMQLVTHKHMHVYVCTNTHTHY